MNMPNQIRHILSSLILAGDLESQVVGERGALDEDVVRDGLELLAQLFLVVRASRMAGRLDSKADLSHKDRSDPLLIRAPMHTTYDM